MAITTNCSGCGKTLAVADEFAGRQARCPACGQIYTVPAPVSPTPHTPVQTPLNPLEPIGGHSAPAPLDLGAPMQSPSSPAPNLSGLESPALGALNTSGGTAKIDSSSGSSGTQFWMRAADGTEYGPADNATLARWFTEGRVGANYQIRIGQYGHWQPAAAFQPIVSGSTSMPPSGINPYAAQSTFTVGVASGRVYPKGDQSGLVLAMGILAWIGGCPIFGIIAWVVGAQALADINAGQADPSSRGTVQVGYYLGMINVILCIACAGFLLVSIFASAIFA